MEQEKKKSMQKGKLLRQGSLIHIATMILESLKNRMHLLQSARGLRLCSSDRMDFQTSHSLILPEN